MRHFCATGVQGGQHQSSSISYQSWRQWAHSAWQQT